MHAAREEVAPDHCLRPSSVVADERREGEREGDRADARRGRRPETIEKRTLVSDATTPASTLPSVGALVTCASSIPESRPRIESGVAVSRIVERKIGADRSAAPATASSASATQSASANPNGAIAAPQIPAATQHGRAPDGARG